MSRIHALVVLFLGLVSSPALAVVDRSAPDGFLVRRSLTVSVPPDALWKGLGHIGRWWSPAHSWSGDARNLSLELRAGGCYCERWRGGSAEHGRVVMARRNELLRLHAALGPLQEMALFGALAFELQPAAGGSALVVTYRVSGDSLHGLDKLAPAVDGVIGEQVMRLKRYLETGSPDETGAARP
jgi:uncharacterized protein YndB with AHSA1/START domain